jgi:carbonic anhydrase
MAEHRCKACIVYCMDFRLHQPLANFFAGQKLEADGADVIRVAGAIKSLSRPEEARDREFLLEQLNVAYQLHGVRQFYLINHEDCGAYGLEDVVDSPEEFATHRQDLHVARILLKDRFPDTEIFTYFMRLSGKAEVVD